MWKRLCLLLTLTYVIPFIESTSAGDPHWVPFKPGTASLPADAIVGGYENETLYISRAPHNVSLTPGMFVPSKHKVIISWHNHTYVKNVNEILCGRNYEWVATTTDYIPESAVVGGRSEINDETLYICRANCSGHLIVGKVHKYCYLPCDGEVKQLKLFEILIAHYITTTSQVSTKATTPSEYATTIPTPREPTKAPPEHTTSLSTPQVPTTDPALSEHTTTITTPQVNSSTTAPRVQTLLTESTSVDEPHWVPFNPDTDTLPADAIVGGYEDETLYISRASHERSLTPGKFVPSRHNAIISWNGHTHVKRVTEILCGRNYQWVATTIGNIPDEAVVGGHSERNDETLYICRGNCSGHLIVGKVHKTDGFCYLSCGEDEKGIEEHFEVLVAPKKCLIPRKPNTEHTMPLISIPSPAKTWPTSDSTTDYLQVEPGQTVIFSCDNSGGETSYFQKFPEQDVISASCIGQDKFTVGDKSYKISELQCAEVHTVLMKKHDKCLSETSELYRVGYEVHGFLETYEVCFDTANEKPLYSHAKMYKSNRGDDVTYKWHKYHELKIHRDTYTCDDATSTCCYSKAQLVNARDVSAGPPQRTTFIDPLNAVPHWRPCGMAQSPWENIEDTVRSLIDSYDQIDVWSGTHMFHETNGTITPRYLWKVLVFDDTKSIAVVYVNGPSPSEADILCKNTCGDDEAVPWSYDYSEHTYCCNVDEFLHAFGLGGSTVGKPMQRSFDTILRKKFSASNLLLRKLTERTSNAHIYFVNSNR